MCKSENCPCCNQNQICRLSCTAVSTHLSIVAEIINRLANNSNYCKAICITVVTVFFTFSKDPNWVSLTIWAIPVITIAFLDSLFVYLKKRLSAGQQKFVSQFMTDDQLKIAKEINLKFPTKETRKKKDFEMVPYMLSHASNKEVAHGMLRNLKDLSIWLFYLSMILTLTLYVLFVSLGFINLS